MHLARGKECKGAMSPAKITSVPPDLQNGLQASVILSPHPAFKSLIKIFFHF